MTDESLIITPNAYQAGAILGHRPSAYDANKVIPVEVAHTRNSVAMRRNKMGVWVEAPANVPRLSWRVGGLVQTLLEEPQRQNYYLNNATFSGYILAGVTLSGNTVTETTASTHHSFGGQFYTGLTNAVHTFSVFVKKMTGSGDRWARIKVSNGIDGELTGQWLNLQTGVLSGTLQQSGSWSGIVGSRIIEGDSYYRLIVSGTSTVGTSAKISTEFSNDAISSIYTGDTSYSYKVLYYQAEVGTYASSPIITGAAAVTRLQDATFRSAFQESIGQTEGSFYMEFVYNGTFELSQFLLGVFGGGNEIYLRAGANNSMQFVHYYTTSLATIIKSSISLGTHKVAVRYKNGDWAMYFDGLQVGVINTPGAFSGSISNFTLGYISPSAYPTNLEYVKIKLWKRALNNLELSSETTL